VVAFCVGVAAELTGTSLGDAAPSLSFQHNILVLGAKSFIDVEVENTGSQDVIGLNVGIHFLVPPNDFSIVPRELLPFCTLMSNRFRLSLLQTNAFVRGSEIKMTFVTDGENVVTATANGTGVDVFGEARQLVRGKAKNIGFAAFFLQHIGVAICGVATIVILILARKCFSLIKMNDEMRTRLSTLPPTAPTAPHEGD